MARRAPPTGSNFFFTTQAGTETTFTLAVTVVIPRGMLKPTAGRCRHLHRSATSLPAVKYKFVAASMDRD
jgi:hypothetical protein